MVKRQVTLSLTHETIEELKRRHINISAYVDRFIAELLFAAKHGNKIRIGRVKVEIKPRG